MSETTSEDGATPAGRRNVDAALARIEAKVDVAIAQHGARLDEHTRDISDLKSGARRQGDLLTAVVTAQAAADAVAKAAEGQKPRRMDVGSWIAIVLALLTVLYLILDHYSGPSGP